MSIHALMVEMDLPTRLDQIRRELDNLARIRLSQPLTAEQTHRYELLLGHEQLLLISRGREPS